MPLAKPRKRDVPVLVLKPHWTEMVVSGKKTWEIRSRATALRRTVRIAASKPVEKILGEVKIVAWERVNEQTLLDNQYKHCIPDVTANPELKKYKKVFAWVLEDAAAYKEPLAYVKKKGAVNWVSTCSGTGSRRKSYRCDFDGCSYSTCEKRHFDEHMRVHTEEKRFKCNVVGCSKASAKESH